MDAFAAYVAGRMRAMADDLSWRAYVAECLRLAPQGMTLSERWADGLFGAPTAEDIDPQEIFESVIRDGGLEVIG